MRNLILASCIMVLYIRFGLNAGLARGPGECLMAPMGGPVAPRLRNAQSLSCHNDVCPMKMLLRS